MAKYSFEFKKKVVLAYINGEGGYGYKRKVRMDESCSIQAPSSSCIKKNETTEVVS